MKRAKLIILTLVLGSFLFVSCHKYPEDPFISFKRPAKRIEGTWNITSYQIWGKEHSHDFDSLLTPNTLTNLSINFNPYNFITDAANGGITFVDKNNNPVFPGEGSFEFTDGYAGGEGGISSVIDFGYGKSPSDSTFINLFFLGKKSSYPTNNYLEWVIEELYTKHFHIHSVTGGIDIYFTKQ